MFDRMSYDRALEAPLTNGPIQSGDALVGFYDPTTRGVGNELAEGALENWYLELDWRREGLTDDNGRAWKFGQLVTEGAASLEPLRETLEAAEGAPHIHAIAGMNSGLVPELRRMVRGTQLGVILNRPFSSQLMRMVQYQANEGGTLGDTKMYETFTMGHGPIIATPQPEAIVAASERLGYEARHIGEIVAKSVIRIRSQGFERNGQILSYDV
ncbi:MAG TPA: AIR synthase-related protein [Candidatus Saccharimonadales bacterium]|nr:AIR synthase-related protein [Candidatus Saccharimonadales bacterium]